MTWDQGLKPIKRKPSHEWFFWDNSVTGIVAYMDYERSHRLIILPYNITDGMRDLIIWGFDAGLQQGKHDGESDAKDEIRKAIGAARE